MSIKSIPLKTWEVQAILDNRKSTLRRVVKMDRSRIYKAACAAGRWSETFAGEIPDEVAEWYAKAVAKPPYHPGDVLWVRETWCKLARVDENRYTHYDDFQYYYATEGDSQIDLYDADGFLLDDQRMKWHPSIHMPREAARLFLRVKLVRVERLQTMDVINCVREGATWHEYPCAWTVMAKPAFIELWNSAIKPADLPRYGWDANPWVFVVEFERCEKPEGWL